MAPAPPQWRQALSPLTPRTTRIPWGSSRAATALPPLPPCQTKPLANKTLSQSGRMTALRAKRSIWRICQVSNGRLDLGEVLEALLGHVHAREPGLLGT